MGEEASFDCEACKRLAAVYLRGEPEEKLKEPEEKEEAEGFRKKGRPAKSKRQIDVLQKYVAGHRSGIYQPIKPDDGKEGEEEEGGKRFHYFCIPCQKVVNFFRDAVTYVHLHESQSASHGKGLQASGLTKDGTPTGERAACTGVRGASLWTCTASGPTMAQNMLRPCIWLPTPMPDYIFRVPAPASILPVRTGAPYSEELGVPFSSSSQPGSGGFAGHARGRAWRPHCSWQPPI